VNKLPKVIVKMVFGVLRSLHTPGTIFFYLSAFVFFVVKYYTAFHKNIPAGIRGCKKKRLNNGTFF